MSGLRAIAVPRAEARMAADNPYYGIYVNADGRQNRRMEITKIQFIRTGGAFEEGDGLIHAAVCLDHVDTCVFRDNLIDDAGVFWYFAPVHPQAGRQESCRSADAGMDRMNRCVTDMTTIFLILRTI